MSHPTSYHATHATPIDARAQFISRTYTHLLVSVLLFIAIEAWLFATGLGETMAQAMLGTSWLLVLGGFMLVSWMATRVAHSVESPVLQYLALFGFVLAESIIFVPLLYIAESMAPGTISWAGIVTAAGFAVLTGIAFHTRKDFSFLRGALIWGGFAALAAIVIGVVAGFSLGPFFALAMVAYAGAAILYDTSNVIHHYPEDRHVAASLQLFASVALMLWYVIQILMSFGDD